MKCKAALRDLRPHLILPFVSLFVFVFALDLQLSTGGEQPVADQMRTTASAELVGPMDQLSISQLQEQLESIDRRLQWLAPYSLRGGVGSIGYRSDWRGPTEGPEWLEVALGNEYPIDQIILVPTLWRDAKEGFRSDGFPEAIRVLVGTDADREGTVVAEYDINDKIEPRIGPLVVTLKQTNASWVRIEATRLSKRAFDGERVFQLAELLVFSESTNVALRQDVSSRSNAMDRAGAWDVNYAVDGMTPYLMDSSAGSQSLPYVSRFGEQPILYLDLGSEYSLDGIHLHAVDQDDTVPLAHGGDLGVPNRLLIEGALDRDFTDPKLLLDLQRKNIHDVGPMMMWKLPKTTCRFVRLRAAKPKNDQSNVSQDVRIGFAEIELYSKGLNVALGKRAFTSSQSNPSDRTPDALTDGKNMFGKILPIRTWLNELSKRHDLEGIRPLVIDELNRRYERQKMQLTRVTWLAAFLAVGIGVTFLIDRIIRMRQLAALKSRFAADLHDELGADLHVIALLSDLSRSAVNNPQEHESIQQRIRVMTQRSSDAVRHCTNLLEAKGLYGDLLEDMQRATERIMADFDGGFSYQDDAGVLRTLKPQTRADLFLFYKECLVNISRHSDGTHFDARLETTAKEISLTVSDDGRGLPDDQIDRTPRSLGRRAKLLGADVTVTGSGSKGTTITLNMKTRQWGIRK